jgi:hypothetical protein
MNIMKLFNTVNTINTISTLTQPLLVEPAVQHQHVLHKVGLASERRRALLGQLPHNRVLVCQKGRFVWRGHAQHGHK